eukprot:GGOE01014329.1.p1 GENE.GGOE01014329.1~~GGOE01014329.1.p1  ORF type:complete len:853 (-),score=290.04 GGOE01014329.1:254-2812(-)
MVDHHSAKAALLRTKYRAVHSIGQVFAGTRVELAGSQEFLLCRCPDKVFVIDVETGATRAVIDGLPEDVIQCLALGPNDDDLVLCQKSRNMVLCSIARQKVVKQWMGHAVPACVMKYHPTAALLVAASPDTAVILWNTERNTLQQRFKVNSIPLCIAFHPGDPDLLAVGDQVGAVTLYHTARQSVLMQLTDHLSHCTSLCFSPSGSHLFTCSRDKTVQVYAAADFKKVKAWVIVEEILSIAAMSDDHLLVCGSSARMRVFKGATGELVSESSAYPHTLLQCHYLRDRSEAIAVTADQCLLFYGLGLESAAPSPPTLLRTLSGYLDAVGDVRWLDGGLRFVVVTNSLNPRIYRRGSHFCEELHGHTDIPASLAVTSDSRYVASAGKDRDVRLWSVQGPRSRCIGQLSGHTAYITAIAFTHTSTPNATLLLLISVDVEGFARVWNCSGLLDPKRTHRKATRKPRKKGAAASPEVEDEGQSADGIPEGFFFTAAQSETTIKASESALSTLAVAPNNLLVAAGGKARVVYVWRLSGNALSSPVPLKGHRRAITAVQFSPVDKLLVSCCAFGMAMVWNLVDYQCIRTLQNDKGVGLYQARFLNHGVQIATTDALGMLKLWVVKTAECLATISSHSEEEALRDVWALDVTPDDEYIITGGTDSRINILKDFTETDRQAEFAQKQVAVLDTQRVQNLMREGQWEEAVLLALRLNRKNDVRIILATMLHTLGDAKGPARMEVVVAQWDEEQLGRLLRYCRDWNTHSQHCHVAQAVLGAVFRVIPPSKLANHEAMTEVLEALTAYNTRHYARLSGLLQKTFLLDYALSALMPVTCPPPAAPAADNGAANGVDPIDDAMDSD